MKFNVKFIQCLQTFLYFNFNVFSIYVYVCLCVYIAFTKTVRVAGQDYQLELIDTAGQDELSIVSQSHSMNLDGYVLVYSVTSEKRFTHNCLLTYLLTSHILCFVYLLWSKYVIK